MIKNEAEALVEKATTFVGKTILVSSGAVDNLGRIIFVPHIFKTIDPLFGITMPDETIMRFQPVGRVVSKEGKVVVLALTMIVDYFESL